MAQHTTGLPIKLTITGGTISGYTALCESNPSKNDQLLVDKIPTFLYQGGEFKIIEGGDAAVYNEEQSQLHHGRQL